MTRETTINGTWIYTVRVYGRLLISEHADRNEAFRGLMALMDRRIRMGAGRGRQA